MVSPRRDVSSIENVKYKCDFRQRVEAKNVFRPHTGREVNISETNKAQTGRFLYTIIKRASLR